MHFATKKKSSTCHQFVRNAQLRSVSQCYQTRNIFFGVPGPVETEQKDNVGESGRTRMEDLVDGRSIRLWVARIGTGFPHNTRFIAVCSDNCILSLALHFVLSAAVTFP